MFSDLVELTAPATFWYKMWSKSSIRDRVPELRSFSGYESMANFAILRTGKLKSAASVKGMLKHNFRTIDTPNADASLTKSNEHLTALSVEDGMRRYRSRLPDRIRKNAVHAIDYMVTTSPEADATDNARALDEAYDWLCEKHGQENVIMASKHFDETTPHAHFVVMPIKDGKLNARHFIGGSKHRMSDLQDEFIDRLKSKNINLDRGVRGSKAKHQSTTEWTKKNKQIREQSNQSVNAEIDAKLTKAENKVLGRTKAISKVAEELGSENLLLRKQLKDKEQTFKDVYSVVREQAENLKILDKAQKGDTEDLEFLTADLKRKRLVKEAEQAESKKQAEEQQRQFERQKQLARERLNQTLGKKRSQGSEQEPQRGDNRINTKPTKGRSR